MTDGGAARLPAPLIGVVAVALGFIICSTAGGIATLFGLLLVLPGLGLLLPASWQDHLLPYLPSNAGASMVSAYTTAEWWRPPGRAVTGADRPRMSMAGGTAISRLVPVSR